MPRSVITKNGKVIKNVPDDITDEQLEKMLRDRKEQEPVVEGVVTPPVEEEPLVETEPATVKEVTPEIPELSGNNLMDFQGDPDTEGSFPLGEAVVSAGKSALAFAGALRDEVGRSIVSEIAEPIANTILDVRRPFQNKEDQARDTALAAGFFSMTDTDKPVTVDPETGRVDTGDAHTLAGKIAPYLLGAGTALRVGRSAAGAIRLVGSTNTAASVLVGSGLLEQSLFDPEDGTLFDWFDEMTNQDQSNALLNYLSSDEDDSLAEQRLSTAFQDVMFVGALSTLFGGIKKISKFLPKKGDGITPKNIEDLTGEEAGGVVTRIIKKIKRRPQSSIPVPEAQSIRQSLGEGIDPDSAVNTVIKQASNNTGPTGPTTVEKFSKWFTWFKTQANIFEPRGGLTPNGFKLKNATDSSKRAALQDVEEIGFRLNRSLHQTVSGIQDAAPGWKESPGFNSWSKSSDDVPEELIDAVNRALAGDRQALKALPKEVKVQVQSARRWLDNMTKHALESPGLDDQLRETLQGNIGKYVTRTFRMFEDANFKHTAEAYGNALEEETRRILKSKSAEFVSIKDYAKAEAKAAGRIDELLEGGRRQYVEHHGNVARVNLNILKRRNKSLDNSPALRKLMGEVTDPADKVVTSAAKMVDLVFNNRYYEGLEALGKDRWMFSAPQGKFTTKITGTNSLLDFTAKGRGSTGYYTTAEMATTLKSPNTTGIFNGNLLTNFGLAKGLSQKSKTVWSHPTHMKNLIGGYGFRAANGYLPFSPNSEKALSVVWDNINKGGDEVLESIYKEYLDLGIINTNTKIGEFRQLIEDGVANSGSLADKMAATADKLHLTGAGKVLNVADRVYMGTDDYFKINTFLDYTETLKKAFPNMSDEVLRRQSAAVTRNIIPNYDLVAPLIKDLRRLPLGNFAGFSSEILRTSVNIAKLGFKEATSGNAVLAERGLQRLIGLTTVTSGGFGGLAALTQNLAGIDTDEKVEALRISAERPFSENVNPLARLGDDGTLYTLDMSTVNPYAYIGQAVKGFINPLMEGTATEEAFGDSLADSVASFGKEVLAPYLSESILTEALIESTRLVITQQDTIGQDLTIPETIWLTGETMLEAFTPGAVTSFKRLDDAVKNKPQEPTGTTRDLSSETDVNMSGLRWTPVRPVDNVEFASSDFGRSVRSIPRLNPSFTDTPEIILEKYRVNLEAHYNAQAILSRKVNASITLGMPQDEVQRILSKDLNVDMATNIILGTFTPPSDATRVVSVEARERFAIAQEVGGERGMSPDVLISEIAKLNNEAAGASLVSFKRDDPANKLVTDEALGNLRGSELPEEKIDE